MGTPAKMSVRSICVLTAAVVALQLHSQKAVRQIPFVFTNNQIFVAVEISGRKFDFLFDTGAEATVIDEQVARELNVKPVAGAQASGVGGLKAVGVGTLPSLSLAGFTERNLLVAICDLRLLKGYIGRRVDGVLGNNFLYKYVVTIDYAARNIQMQTVESVKPRLYIPSKRDAVEFSWFGGRPAVKCVLDDEVEGWFVIDTGSMSAATLTKTMWGDLKNIEGQRQMLKGAKAIGIDGAEFQVWLARVRSLQIGSLKVNEPIVEVQPALTSGMFSEEDAPGLLGNEALMRFRVTINYPERTVVLERRPGARAAAEARYSSTGIGVIAMDDKHVVRSVWDPSPALEAGIKEGDELVAIDGQSVAGLTLEAVRKRLSGPEGTQIRLTLRRGDEILNFTLQRRKLL